MAPVAAQVATASPARPAWGHPSARFPIVAIGASAGGLEAFTKFLARMPVDSGMAFVLVPHLDPSHESLMAELLARQTAMPVLEAKHQMPIRPDHVYVIPPNKYLAIKGRRLLLSRPPKLRAGQTAIDFALRSLAEDQQENAIGIVLSGTGGHGTAGLKEIKLAGGMVMVQDPTTAAHAQMPRSALEAGIGVDYVLAPEDMPDALLAYSQRASRQRAAQTKASSDAAILEGLEVILDLLESRTKHDFHHYRKNMIMRRIQRRMLLSGIEDIHKYIERLQQDADELTSLRRDLSISVTEFFREPEAFKVLAAGALPDLIRHASADTPVRVWVPACATGEEAYSIAILLIEQFKAAGKEAYLQMFASDIDEESLKIARQGIYSESIVESVSPERLKSFFVPIDLHRFQVSKQLRDAIVFAAQNLISDPPFSRLDLISCRNALIYLEPDFQAKVISLLHYGLNEGGCLLLGPAESLGAAAELFEPISKKWRVYRKIGPVHHHLVSIPIAASTRRLKRLEQPDPIRPRVDGITELMQRLLLRDFMPAAVLVNRKYKVLSVQGPVVNFLEIPPGKMTDDLMAMAREPLRARIRATCQKAIRKGGTVRDLNAQVRRDGHYLPCSISVRAITEPREAQRLLLIVFEERASAHAVRSRRRGASADYSAMRLLEDELRGTRDDLQRTVAELERSNEDLKASNEEIMSMNEELQSANEELETSKEELQSANEDLSTANSQLEGKVHELDTANNDMTNLMVATDIAIVFLDRELRIKRFTPPAAKLLSLVATDVGRSLPEFVSQLTDGGLVLEAQHAMATGTACDREIRSAMDRCYLRRVLPYNAAGGPTGVVVTYIDVTERVKAEAQSRHFAAVLRDSTDAIALMELDGRITAWNRGAEIMYGYAEPDAVKMNIHDLTAAESSARTSDTLQRIARGEVVPAFEAKRRTRDGRLIDVWATVTLLRDAAGKPASLATTERDVTVQRQSARQLRAILDATPNAVVTIDQTGKIVTFNQSAVQLFGYRADEATGQNVSMLMPPSERGQHDVYLSRYRQTREPHILGRPREVRGCRKDGTIFPITLSVTEIEQLGLFTGFMQDMTAAKALQEEILNIAVLEQRRIGQELHDGTQQDLTGLGLMAQNLTEALSRQGSEAEATLAARLASGIAQAHLHVRSLAHGLVPVPVDAETLPAALGELAKSTRETYNLSCRFDYPAPVHVSNATTATHLYRIAQEAVGNAIRHAKADTIAIRLGQTDADLVLEIRDNGIGIASRRPPYEGAGLRLMEHRCAVIGGRFTVQGFEGGGTLVACAIPREGRT